MVDTINKHCCTLINPITLLYLYKAIQTKHLFCSTWLIPSISTAVLSLILSLSYIFIKLYKLNIYSVAHG